MMRQPLITDAHLDRFCIRSAAGNRNMNCASNPKVTSSDAFPFLSKFYRAEEEKSTSMKGIEENARPRFQWQNEEYPVSPTVHIINNETTPLPPAATFMSD